MSGEAGGKTPVRSAPPPAGGVARSGRIDPATALLLVVTAAIVGYVGVLQAPFVYDDHTLILENFLLRGRHAWWEAFTSSFWSLRGAGADVSGYYRPLVILSYMLDARCWGFHPAGFHLTNVLAHAATSALVFWSGRRVLGSEGAALAAGLLFALHPVHTEAVSWIAGRCDVFTGLFGVGAFGCLARAADGRGGGWAFLALALAGFLLALLAKEAAVMLPLLFAVYLGQKRADRRLVAAAAAGCCGVLALYALLRFGLAHTGLPPHAAGPPPCVRLLTVGRILFEDCRLLVLPVGLNLMRWLLLVPVTHVLSAGALLGAAFVAAFAAAAWRLRAAPEGFGLAWIGLCLLPVLNLVPLPMPVAERFLYLPSAGFCWLAASLLARWPAVVPTEAAGRPRPLPAHAPAARLARVRFMGPVVLCVLVLYAVGTAHRNRDWADEERLWRQTLAATPQGVDARLSLGILERERGAFADSARELASVIQQVPLSADGYFQLAQTRAAAGDAAGAEAAYRQGIAAGARPVDLLQERLGSLYLQEGRVAAAVARYHAALTANPNSAAAHYDLGVAFARQRRWAEAAAEYERALRLRPEDYPARYNLEVARRKLGAGAGSFPSVPASARPPRPAPPTSP